jgi:hypothetical protein
MIEAQEHALYQAKRLNQFKTMRMLGTSIRDLSKSFYIPRTKSSDSLHITATAAEEEAGCIQDEIMCCMEFEATCLPSLRNRLVIQLCVILVLLFLFGMGIERAEGKAWTVSATVYYSIVTACTIGYGDLHPETTMGRLLAIFFVPLAVGATGHWLSLVANQIIEHRQSKFRKMYQAKEFTPEDLDMMDEDGDGQVCRADFLEFMLVAMGKIDRQLLDELRKHFERLDVDGSGYLDKADLVAAARKKLRTPEGKQLQQAYKDKLRGMSSGNLVGSGNLTTASAFTTPTTSAEPSKIHLWNPETETTIV